LRILEGKITRSYWKDFYLIIVDSSLLSLKLESSLSILYAELKSLSLLKLSSKLSKVLSRRICESVHRLKRNCGLFFYCNTKFNNIYSRLIVCERKPRRSSYTGIEKENTHAWNKTRIGQSFPLVSLCFLLLHSFFLLLTMRLTFHPMTLISFVSFLFRDSKLSAWSYWWDTKEKKAIFHQSENIFINLVLFKHKPMIRLIV
jgi:hypothetical protein